MDERLQSWYRWVRGARTKKACDLNQCSGSSTWDCSGTEDTATRTTSCEGNRRSLLIQKKKCTSQLLVGKDLHSLQTNPTAGSSCLYCTCASLLVLLSPLCGYSVVSQQQGRDGFDFALRVITNVVKPNSSGAQQEVIVSLRCPGWVRGQIKLRCSRFWVEYWGSDVACGSSYVKASALLSCHLF